MAGPGRDSTEPLNAQIANDGEGRQDAVDLDHDTFMSISLATPPTVTPSSSSWRPR